MCSWLSMSVIEEMCTDSLKGNLIFGKLVTMIGELFLATQKKKNGPRSHLRGPFRLVAIAL